VIVAQRKVALLKRKNYDRICGAAAGLNGEAKYPSEMQFE